MIARIDTKEIEPSLRISELIAFGGKRLRSISGDRSLSEARLLLAKVLGETRGENLFSRDHEVVPPAKHDLFLQFLERRLHYEPIAYILGKKEFYGFEFIVNPDVLIPRPETESLVSGILEWIQQRGISSGRILDLGSGSGCIAIALSKELGSEFQIVGIDISEKALEVARLNARKLMCSAIFQRGDVLQGPVTTEAKSTVIVSNPPYIPSCELPNLQTDVRDFEPHLSLDGSVDGLRFHRAIIEKWVPTMLAENGLLALEVHNLQQREALIPLLSSRIMTVLPKLEGPYLFCERLGDR